jgi:hypothetical protein
MMNWHSSLFAICKTVKIISDVRFNHISGDNEDVEFIAGYDPCDFCGGTGACDCSICQLCLLDTRLECRCFSTGDEDFEHRREGSPSKRRRLDDVIHFINRTEAAVLDPKGASWASKMIPRPRRVVKDSYNMALVKDITGVKQLYSSYGTLTNPKLLLTYGFLGPFSKRDKVSLQKELFYEPEHFTVSSGLSVFWKELGYRFIVEVAKISDPSHHQDLVQLVHDEECSIDQREFVWWSLAIRECGWIPFPLKVWGLLCLLDSDQLDQFLNSSFKEKVETVGGLVSATFQKDDNISTEFLEWTRLIVPALEKRISRYALRPEEVQNVYEGFKGDQSTPFGKIDVLFTC